jgi:muconolactone delta-isomerase
MKILSIGKPKESLLSLPPDKRRELMEATLETNKRLRDEGKIVNGYVSPGSGYIFVILDYDSTEEWMKDLNASPILNYYDQETYPVVGWDDAMKISGMT